MRNNLFQQGFSLFELLIVLIVISILLYFGISKYQKPIDDATRNTFIFQANTFSRTVLNLHGQSKIGGNTFITLMGVKINLNEHGWPANTNDNLSALSKNQTPEECQQIWNALFQNPPSSSISANPASIKENYRISSINGRICRYKLMRKQEDSYFFDYYLETGDVITSPLVNIE